MTGHRFDPDDIIYHNLKEAEAERNYFDALSSAREFEKSTGRKDPIGTTLAYQYLIKYKTPEQLDKFNKWLNECSETERINQETGLNLPIPPKPLGA